MRTLKTEFTSRTDLVAYLREQAPWAQGNESKIVGGRDCAIEKLNRIDVKAYGENRNYSYGNVSQLSPYIQHGILKLGEVRDHVLKNYTNHRDRNKFLQELCWRDFWQRALTNNPEWAWQDIESYKTGFVPEDYSRELPQDIASGSTGLACIDGFINELLSTGYLHNHARMYLASYVIHFRRVRWQEGAAWFLAHLLDGNIASNNLSWQWIASTFSNKPYIFNLENVQKYFGTQFNTSPECNRELDASYEQLQDRLFPNLRGLQ